MGRNRQPCRAGLPSPFHFKRKAEYMRNHTRRGIERLRELRQEHDSAAVEMAIERGRFDAIREGGPTVAVSAFNLFQTPPEVAWQLAGLLPRGGRILEPSAGLGRIVDAVARRCDPAELVAVEVASQCAEQLYKLDACRLIVADFLECDAARLGGLFDAVVMNPPFKQGRDIKHIMHAFSMLKPGGLLVALCFDGVKQNRDLRPWADTWEALPAESFKTEGTRACVARITTRK